MNPVVVANVTVSGDVLAAILLVSSPLACFWGAALFKIVLGIIGFLVAGYLTSLFCHWFSDKVTRMSSGVELIIVLIFSIGGAILLVLVYKAALFTTGAVVGLLAGNTIYSYVIAMFTISDPLYIRIPLLLLCSLIGGYLAFKVAEKLLQITTPFIGAFMFVAAIDHFGYRLDLWKTLPFSPEPSGQFFQNPRGIISKEPAHGIILLLLWIILTISGLMYQLKMKLKNESKGQDYREL